MTSNKLKNLRSSWAVAALLVLASLASASAWAAPAARNVKFDHVRTGFPLSGAHATIPCDTCHIQGTFKGTPRECAGCHIQGNRIATTFKPANHIPTSKAPKGDACEQCHVSTASWSVARFNHVGVTPNNCRECHNNVMAKGKPSGHIVTDLPCDACHRTTIWTNASFNHTGVAPGSCATCHNGTRARGKHNGHVATNAACDSCHRMTAWIPATFGHVGVMAGACATCHGSSARGKPNNHIPTTLSCDACHTTGGSFTTNRFTHSAAQGVVARQCATCHSGAYTMWNALGKTPSPPHPVTTDSCDQCHTGYQSFAGASNFNHAGVTPGGCATCHGTTARGKPAGHIPTGAAACDACHTTGGSFATRRFSHSATQNVLPAQCNTCHSGAYAGAPWNARGLAPGHIPVGAAACDACHTTGGSFTTRVFSHGTTQNVTPGQCATCHNGAYTRWNALGKTPSPPHPVTTASCDNAGCHSGYQTFAGASFNHTGVTPGTCATCHGTTARGKPAGHIPTGAAACDACHTTGGSFATRRFTHAATQNVTPGQCSTCHNGAYAGSPWNAQGLATNHIPTGAAACDACHTTGGSFATRRFTHAANQNVAPGGCNNCHNGAYTQWNAQGKTRGHPATSLSCDAAGCHTRSCTTSYREFCH